MTVKLPPTGSSSYEDDSSSGEEGTDSGSETERVADSKTVETSSKPKTTANSLSEVETDSPVVKLIQERPTASSSYEDASSSSEEEETEPVAESKKVPETLAHSSSGEETDSEPETEPVAESKKVPETMAFSSSGEESDSEPETEPVVESKKVPETMAHSSSGEETDPPVTNPVVKPPADSSSSKVQASSKKRSIETDEGEAKRVKRVSGDDDKQITGQETKKNYFQRVWTEEDEIALLQGIIDYKKETGSNPFDDKNALYELVKKSISFDATKTQFLEKMRGLKKKFETNKGKEKKKGEEPTFSKPHDLKAFQLSKLVWGDDVIMAHAIDVEPAVLKPVEPKQEFVSIVESVCRFGVDHLFAKKGWSRLSSEDKKSIEEEWEAFQLEELKFYSRKSRIIHDVVTKMAEASEQDH